MNAVRRALAILRIAPAALFLAAGIVDPALAQGWSSDSQVLSNSCTLLNQIKDWIFTVVYVLGAIGLVLIAISAFLGRFKFAHLIALGGGLFIVASADLLIDFVGGDDANCTV